jgi:acylaminoacyl-peptidase
LPSPSGRKLILVKQEESSTASNKNNNKVVKRQVMEIWEDEACLSRRIVLESSLHGSIINDASGFGQPSWNAEETLVVYSAEKAPMETSNYWDSKGSGSTSKDTSSVPRGGVNVLGQGRLEEWGEQYPGQNALHDLFVVNIVTGRVGRVNNVPGGGAERTSRSGRSSSSLGGVTLGQASFHPQCSSDKVGEDGQEIVYTGWDAGALGEMPRRLGMIFCRNRPCKIYTSNISFLLQELSSSSSSLSFSAENNQEESGRFEYLTKEKKRSCRCWTPDRRLSRSAQFVVLNKDMKKTTSVVFLSHPNPEGFESHDGCMGLHQIDMLGADDGFANQRSMKDGDDSIEELVPIVYVPSMIRGNVKGPSVAGMGFPGLFTWDFLQPPPTPTNEDNGFIYMSSIWGSAVKVIRFHIPSGTLSLMKIECDNENDNDIPDEEKCHTLLCITPKGGLLVQETAPNQPGRILSVSKDALTDSRLKDNDPSRMTVSTMIVPATIAMELSPIAATSFSSVGVKSTTTVKSMAEQFSYQIVTLLSAPKIEGAVDIAIQSVLMLPSTTKDRDPRQKFPLIVIPHGGPHSCSVASYLPGAAYLCANGYALLFPNYRGSTGFGQASIDSLLGRVGKLDVADVMATMRHFTSTVRCIDERRIGICGGSHGGFITGHVTGQYPTAFKAAAMRNPVTNIASMVTGTDIPDWCYVECLGTYGANWELFRAPTSEQMQTMYSKSPVVYVDQVVTPTLVALGKADLRVPPSQGLEWYHALRSKGNVPTRLLVYPDDNHSLSQVTTEVDHWIEVSSLRVATVCDRTYSGRSSILTVLFLLCFANHKHAV